MPYRSTPTPLPPFIFLISRLEDGRALKILAVTDEYTRDSLAIIVGNSLGSADVVLTLNDIAKRRGLPRYFRSDNGSEFVSEAVKRWFDPATKKWRPS